MAGEFKVRKAQATGGKALIAVEGPAGSGKTLGALILAHAFGKRIVVIDTEIKEDPRTREVKGRSETYGEGVELSGRVLPLAFDVIPFEAPYTPQRYSAALDAALEAGADVVVVDSLSHEWAGTGGILDTVDSGSGKNDFGKWKKPSADHTKFIERLVRFPVHLITTMRTKTAYELQQDKNGKQVPVKIGMAPIQREGVDYEFDVIFDVTLDHSTHLVKANANYADRLAQLVQVEGRITPRLALALRSWIEGATPAPQNGVSKTPTPKVAPAGAPAGQEPPFQAGSPPAPSQAASGNGIPAGGEARVSAVGVTAPVAPTSPAPPPAADVSEDETQYRLDTIYGVSIPAEHMLVHAWILKRRDQEADEIAPADQVALFKRLVYRRHPEGYKDAHVAAGIPQTKDAPVSWRQLRLLAREAAIRCPLGSEPAQVSGQPAAASKDVAPCKG